jgi:hypothetical protein
MRRCQETYPESQTIGLKSCAASWCCLGLDKGVSGSAANCDVNCDRYYKGARTVSSHQGFRYMVSEARTAFAMFCSLLFLISVGSGAWSLEARRGRETN